MGSIVGTSIFVVPQVVARDVPNTAWMAAAWLLGGVAAIAGALVSAELAERRPLVGGTYAYLREAYHPSLAFIYGWCLLLVTQTGAMASVAVIFARYWNELAHSAAPESVIAAIVIAVFTVINCFGVRTGSTVQSILMLAKIAVIGALILSGLRIVAQPEAGAAHPPSAMNPFAGFGAAMVPILFAYGGWHMASFLAGEARDPRVELPRALVLGVTGVVALYLGVNLVCARALGPALAGTPAPVSAVMRMAFGSRGATYIAIGIAISAIGYLSQATLTSPRVYYAMASDGLFFQSVARLSPRTHAPSVAILIQGAAAIVIAFSGKYHQILTYVMSVELFFNILTVGSLFIFRRRDAQAATAAGRVMRGSPLPELIVVALNAGVAVGLFYDAPLNGACGIVIALAGIPVYLCWRERRRRRVEMHGNIAAGQMTGY
jgi:APA family basic amino acid/polyamine antiporter